MTVHKIRMCRCGHELAFHESERGPCRYGRDHAMGGCTCPRFGRRARSDAAAPTRAHARAHAEPIPSLLEAIAGATMALHTLHNALRHAEAARRSGAVSSHAEALTNGAGVTPAPARAKAKPKPMPIAGAEDEEVKLRAGERRMLEALAGYHPTPLTRPQLGTLVGIASRGTTFGTYLGTLTRNGLVGHERGRIWITGEGMQRVEPSRRGKLSREQILARWLGKLRAGERKMLEAVIASGSMTRDELGDVAEIDPRGTTFGTYLGTLRRNDLIVVHGQTVLPGGALEVAR